MKRETATTGYTHTHIHTHTHARMHARTHTDTHTDTHTHTQTHTCKHAHTHAHMHSTRTAHTHTHTHPHLEVLTRVAQTKLNADDIGFLRRVEGKYVSGECYKLSSYFTVAPNKRVTVPQISDAPPEFSLLSTALRLFDGRQAVWAGAHFKRLSV